MMATIVFIIIILYYSLKGRVMIACSYDGNHFFACDYHDNNYYCFYLLLFSEGGIVIAFSYDGNDFGGCVDDVDGEVILRILLSGQRKMNRRTAFRLKNEFEKKLSIDIKKKKGEYTHLYDG